jgi:hypothetical protein
MKLLNKLIMEKFDDLYKLLVAFNKSLKRKMLGIKPDVNMIGHRIIINDIPQCPIYSSRYTTLRSKNRVIIAQYRKCVGFEPL